MAARIAADFPAATPLGEEGERVLGDVPATMRWIVDPPDGTFNFVHGFPKNTSPPRLPWKLTARWRLGCRQPVSGEVFCGRVTAPRLHRVDQPPVRPRSQLEHTLASGLIGSSVCHRRRARA